MYQNRRNMLDQTGRRRADRERREGGGTAGRSFLADRTAPSACRPIAEADVAQFYEQNKDRAQGRTLEQLRGEIKPYLEERRRQQARAMLVEELIAKSGSSVKVMLDAAALHRADDRRGSGARQSRRRR